MALENHKSIQNEWFHWYLNKVEWINMADKGSFQQWWQGVMFSLYAWNAAPINGTDICHSFVTIAQEFPFLVDLSSTTAPQEALAEGQEALDHCDSALPLLYKQCQLLKILNKARWQHHRELKNAGVSQQKFEVGDLVIVWKQIKLDAAAGVAAKLLFKAKGPYQVVEPIGKGSYRIQRLPFCQGLG